MQVKATSNLFVHSGAFKKDEEEEELAPASQSTAKETIFFMDYAGKSSSKLMDVSQHEAVVSGFDEMPETEEKENDKNVDHILDRLIGMLLSNNTGVAGDDQDFNDIHSDKPYWCGLDTEHQMDTEFEESANTILRTSGQAKSVRCLSSQMRQANH